MTQIPSKARQIVRERQDDCCFRCGLRYTEVHHRLRRREGGHAVEILVGLCGECHRWAHAYPAQARPAGYIISVHEADPARVPLRSYMGWVLLNTDGTFTFTEAPEEAA